MTDFEIENARDLVPVLEQVAQSDPQCLMIVARELNKQAIGYLYQINHATDKFMGADFQRRPELLLLVGSSLQYSCDAGQTWKKRRIRLPVADDPACLAAPSGVSRTSPLLIHWDGSQESVFDF